MGHNFDQLYLDILSLLPSFYFQGIIVVVVVGLHFLIFRRHIFQIDEDLLLLLFILVISITCRLEWILKCLRNIFTFCFFSVQFHSGIYWSKAISPAQSSLCPKPWPAHQEPINDNHTRSRLKKVTRPTWWGSLSPSTTLNLPSSSKDLANGSPCSLQDHYQPPQFSTASHWINKLNE